MACVRERWLSGRALSLHVAALVLVPACALAAWWQINRAADGNQLSYLYSVMWPVFGVLAVYFWWMLIHTDFDDVGLKGMRRQQAQSASAEPEAGPVRSPSSDPVGAVEDAELAAYNARLAALAKQGPKTWRARESVVVRREQ
jgi:hypothetical protein